MLDFFHLSLAPMKEIQSHTFFKTFPLKPNHFNFFCVCVKKCMLFCEVLKCEVAKQIKMMP